MRLTLTLRRRVALWFAALGFFLCGLFALATLVIAEDYEHLLVGELLDDAASTTFDARARSRYFRAYAAPDAPAAYRSLPLGVHEFEDGNASGLHIGVYEQDGRRIVVVMELGEIEVLERYLALVLSLIILGGGLLAGGLGWALSSSAIQPVRVLADEVGALSGKPAAARFTAASDDVLAPIATAIASYLQRLTDADSAERRFYADASHELRTPITVIQGATEILRDDAHTTESQHLRLDRIDRAAADLAVMLDAILLAARATPPHGERFALGDLAAAALLRLASGPHGAAGRVTLDVRSAAEVDAPRRWADALLDVLLLRLLAASPDAWRVDVCDDGVYLRLSQSPGGDRPALADRADLGLSLRFAERLAASFGWQVGMTSSAAGVEVVVYPGPLAAPRRTSD